MTTVANYLWIRLDEVRSVAR